jgi:hypothetical protein
MSGFTSHVVAPHEVRTVYPLVREAVAGLDLKTWVGFARKIADPRRAGQGGIVAVTRQGRHLPCGMFLYRREKQLPAGAVLVAEHFVAVDVLDPAPVVEALVATLDTLAERLGCTAIRVLVPGDDSLLQSGLRAAGHRTRGVALGKSVAGAAVAGSDNL